MPSSLQNKNNIPFRITQDETLADGIARVVQQLLACILEYLENYQNDPDSIHQTRVACKRLRAIAKLLRKSLPRPSRQISDEIRDVARLLSLQRDADVKLELIQQLYKSADESQQHLLRQLTVCYEQGAIDQQIFDKNVQHAKVKAMALCEMLETWKFKKLKTAKVMKELGSEWKLAKASYRKNKKESDPVDMHAWRKHTKTCLYQHQLLETHLKPKYAQKIEKLKKLGTSLGSYHDLVLIEEDIEEPIIAGWSKSEQALLIDYIQKNQDKLLKKNLKLGKSLFVS